MKTSEDKLNDALREVLKRKFDDYEEQPNPAAYERIRTRAKPQRGGKYWWLSGGLALLIFSGVLVSRYIHWNDTEFFEEAARHELISEKIKPEEAAARKTSPTISPVLDTRVGVLNDKPGRKPAPGPHKPLAGTVGGATGRVSAVKGSAAATGVYADKAVRSARDVTADKRVAAITHATASADERMPTRETPPASLNEAISAAALPAAIAASADSAMKEAVLLQELAAMPLKEAQVPLHLRGVVTPKFKPAKVIVTNPARVAWLFNASVLQSYQILTVPSSAAQDFQNFTFPALFTSKSTGYKFSAGVERSGIQLQLHYSGFRQTYSYEVAKDSYLVQPGQNGSYTTIRQGDKREEDRKFSMLGIGVTKQLRWGHSPVSRFYAAFGLEYSHALNSSQNLGWVSMGLGKQFAVSRHTAFSIGPYAEFSPVKVKGTANPFYYQPYRVGISAGLRFVRP